MRSIAGTNHRRQYFRTHFAKIISRTARCEPSPQFSIITAWRETMAKPVILAIDDDRSVLNAVDRDLRQKYGRDYRILKADSGASALESVKTLQQRGETVALFVVDQRMPEMTGVQFLEQARTLFPEAKKVLLTAYADTEAAIH